MVVSGKLFHLRGTANQKKTFLKRKGLKDLVSDIILKAQ